jgi:NTP pyrophosphatase (non-canonical NTP hydrolase)
MSNVYVNGATIAYEDMVGKLMKRMATPADDLMHAAVGVSGEAGELLDAVKKHWAYGKELDTANVLEEMGDIEFYLAALRRQIGFSRAEILQANAAKLAARYHSGVYSDEQAIARADKGGRA